MFDKLPTPEWKPWTPVQEPGVEKISSNLLVLGIQCIVALCIVGVLLYVMIRVFICDWLFTTSFFLSSKQNTLKEIDDYKNKYKKSDAVTESEPETEPEISEP